MEKIKYEESEYVKVTKNTKGYNWEIKLVDKPNTDLIERIGYIDDKLRERFGQGTMEVKK